MVIPADHTQNCDLRAGALVVQIRTGSGEADFSDRQVSKHPIATTQKEIPISSNGLFARARLFGKGYPSEFP